MDRVAEETERQEDMVKERENLTNHPKFWDEVSKSVRDKINDFLKNADWQMDDEAENLVPLEAIQRLE